MVIIRRRRRIRHRPGEFPNGVLRSLWYFWLQQGQGGLAPVDTETLAGGVDVLFHRRFGQTQLGGDFLIGQEGRQTQALFLTRGQRGNH